MNAHEAQTDVQGSWGEPCSGCGAPLAADQRYCLNCGLRHGAPRLDFRQYLSAGEGPADRGAVAPASAAAPPPPAEAKPQRDYTPLAAVGGIAVLGLMLLIGVLIGKGDGTTSAPAPPQVVRVEGSADGQETASEEADGAGAAATKNAQAATEGKTAKDASGLVGGKDGGGPVQASDEALKELQEQSPEEYSKNSAKLPDEIATGGAPPPTDDKAPGGGSKGTAIE